MICKPKLYIKNETTKKYSLGGYLLNDEMFTDELILPNYELKEPSKVNHDNILYKLINDVSSVGYKINTELLNFVYTYPKYFGEELINEDHDHPLSEKTKLTKTEQLALQKYYSKLLLQINILNIA